MEIQASKYKQIAEDIERNSSALIPIHQPETMDLQKTINPKQEYQVKIQPSEFLPLDEKEWVHKELSTFIDTL